MEIQSLDLIVEHLYSVNDKETAKGLIKKYGDVRCEGAIQRAWDKATRVRNITSALNRKRIKNEVVSYDEENGCITLTEFVKFYVGLEDELRMYIAHCDKAHATAAMDILNTMSNRLGDIKPDRRILFPKSAWQ